MEELNCKVVFTIPVGKGLPIYESVVVTWIVMAILVLLSIILVRNLKVENPGKKQLALEAGYLFFRNFFHNLLGERGARYIPYMTMIVLFMYAVVRECTGILCGNEADRNYLSDFASDTI